MPRNSRGAARLIVDATRRLVARWGRRRRVAFAYDMAREIQRYLPPRARVLDVGCGNGLIAHLLTAFIVMPVQGVDVIDWLDAPIAFARFDGRTLPFADGAFDAVLSCYVLHHAQAQEALVAEMQRVLRRGGVLVVYEDAPVSWWDRFMCWRHCRAWRKRTGPTTFRSPEAWQDLFVRHGFRVTERRLLSRFRSVWHPVRRVFLVLTREAGEEHGGAPASGEPPRP